MVLGFLSIFGLFSDCNIGDYISGSFGSGLRLSCCYGWMVVVAYMTIMTFFMDDSAREEYERGKVCNIAKVNILYFVIILMLC